MVYVPQRQEQKGQRRERGEREGRKEIDIGCNCICGTQSEGENGN